MTLIVFAVLVALGLLATACLVVIVPSYWVSTTRYELWRLRDELSDAIRNGEFEDATQPKLLRRRIDTSIGMAGWLSFAYLNLVNWIVGDKVAAGGEVFQMDHVNPADRERIAQLVKRYQSAMLRRILLRSWSGLFLGLPWVVITSLGSIIRRGGGSVLESIKGQARREVDVDRSIDRMANGPHKGNLSAYL
jgi:hypothetical protein